MRLYKQKHVTSCNTKHMITTESIWQEEVCEDFFVEVFPILVTCVGLAKIDIHTDTHSLMLLFHVQIWIQSMNTQGTHIKLQHEDALEHAKTHTNTQQTDRVINIHSFRDLER